jgi:hypothetical protein
MMVGGALIFFGGIVLMRVMPVFPLAGPTLVVVGAEPYARAVIELTLSAVVAAGIVWKRKAARATPMMVRAVMEESG